MEIIQKGIGKEFISIKIKSAGAPTSNSPSLGSRIARPPFLVAASKTSDADGHQIKNNYFRSIFYVKHRKWL